MHFLPVPDKMNVILSVGLLLFVAAASAIRHCKDVTDAIEKEFEDLAKTKECSVDKHIKPLEGMATFHECEESCEIDNNCKVVYGMVDGDLYTCDLFQEYCYEVDPDCSTCKVTSFDQISHCKDEAEQAQAITKTVSTGPTTPSMPIGPCGSNVGWYRCDDPNHKKCRCYGEGKDWQNQCISPSRYCDHILDCKNGSDEDSLLCNKNRTCDWRSFKCSDNIQCVLWEEKCNGIKDCIGQSEEPDDCISTGECTASQERCADGRKCIEKWKICTGKPEPECHDGLDENPYRCEIYECIAGYKKCESGDECFEIRRKCNGILDCRDHSDEKGCSSCDNGAQLCDVDDEGNGVCAQICDGLALCVDGADELHCEERNKTASGEDVESGTGMLKTPSTAILVSAVMAAFL